MQEVLHSFFMSTTKCDPSYAAVRCGVLRSSEMLLERSSAAMEKEGRTLCSRLDQRVVSSTAFTVAC